MVSSGTSSALNSEQDLASIPTAQGGLSRLAIARLKSAGVPVVPVLRRVGLTPEVIADPEERLSVRSQITLLEEAAIALQDDSLGFTLARDFDPRALGLLYYVMASSQTLGDALKRVARYSQTTNEALVVRYREGDRLIINRQAEERSCRWRTAVICFCSPQRRRSVSANARDEAFCGQPRPSKGHQTSARLQDLDSDLPQVPQRTRSQESRR